MLNIKKEREAEEEGRGKKVEKDDRQTDREIEGDRRYKLTEFVHIITQLWPGMRKCS